MTHLLRMCAVRGQKTGEKMINSFEANSGGSLWWEFVSVYDESTMRAMSVVERLALNEYHL